VQGQLKNLLHVWVRPAVRELRALNDSVAEWNPVNDKEPRWRTKVTPESESRVTKGKYDKHYWLEEDDGQRYFYGTHARMTPGPGRIHFRLVPATPPTPGLAIIGYIGRKLGSDLDS
jgi:hypothetical protein